LLYGVGRPSQAMKYTTSVPKNIARKVIIVILHVLEFDLSLSMTVSLPNCVDVLVSC